MINFQSIIYQFITHFHQTLLLENSHLKKCLFSATLWSTFLSPWSSHYTLMCGFSSHNIIYFYNILSSKKKDCYASAIDASWSLTISQKEKVTHHHWEEKWQPESAAAAAAATVSMCSLRIYCCSRECKMQALLFLHVSSGQCCAFWKLVFYPCVDKMP